MSIRSLRPATLGAALAAASLLLTGCMSGEADAGAGPAGDGGDGPDGGTLEIDFATYNPLSLVIKEKGWLEAALAEDGVEVTWVQSAGSNKANEALRAGAVDVGSTAGSAALLARANGSPIQVIDLYSQPEWSALVTTPETGITSVTDLEGKRIAATKGTDPYFFLVQALAEAGVDLASVTVENLQHGDGRNALATGQVDAWSGLDPIMADAEADGSVLFYRNVDFNTYGFLNATEEFIETQPEVAQTVVDVYAYARTWAQENPAETAEILADVAGIELDTATATLERTYLDIDHVPGETQLEVLRRVGPVAVETGDAASQDKVDEAIDTIVAADFAADADAERVAAAIEGAGQ